MEQKQEKWLRMRPSQIVLNAKKTMIVNRYALTASTSAIPPSVSVHALLRPQQLLKLESWQNLLGIRACFRWSLALRKLMKKKKILMYCPCFNIYIINKKWGSIILYMLVRRLWYACALFNYFLKSIWVQRVIWCINYLKIIWCGCPCTV